METLKTSVFIRSGMSFLLFFLISCDFNSKSQGQSKELPTEKDGKLVGGPCEGCDAVFEYGEGVLSHQLTLPDFKETGSKIKISGTVYKPGGAEPANGVILYIHHTNQKGVYPKNGAEKEWGKRHGYLRGWIKTNKDGHYELNTLIPGAYPRGSNPQHIHVMVLEPDGKYYYIEDFLFEGDPNLSKERKTRSNPRGGSGFVLNPVKEGGLLTATRDIILGKNIPGYQK